MANPGTMERNRSSGQPRTGLVPGERRVSRRQKRSRRRPLTDTSSSETSSQNNSKAQNVLNELLGLLADDSYLGRLRSELESLINDPTAKQRLFKERALLFPEVGYTDVCSEGTQDQCLSIGRTVCKYKIHFEPIKVANTDPSLGDCSYLDTCYKAKGCKYRHYRIHYPEKSVSAESVKAPKVANFLSASSTVEPVSLYHRDPK